MKFLLVFALHLLGLPCALGQGLINFFNTSSTLVSENEYGASTPINGAVGSFFFGLLTSPVGAGDFTFAGVYATNQTVAGRFNGGVGVAVPGWAPGTARDFEVVGWSANEGPNFNAVWLTVGFTGPPGFLGFSSIGTGAAGGLTSTGTLPNLNIFGGATGIQNGFTLFSTRLPEPSSLG